MKKFGFAAIAASGLAAAVLGLAAPASATVATGLNSTTISTDLDHHDWVHQIGPDVYIPQVDTSVQQSR
jgi:hypothetical protein